MYQFNNSILWKYMQETNILFLVFMSESAIMGYETNL